MFTASNGPQRRVKAQMQYYNDESHFERIVVDVVGPLRRTDQQNKHIIFVMDYFFKWVAVDTLVNQEVATVAEELVKDWVCLFGVPLELQSDQGRNFV